MQHMSDNVKNILKIDPMEATLELLVERILPGQKGIVAKKEAVAVDFFYNHLPASEIISYKSVYTYTIRDIDDNPHTILHQATPLTLNHNNKPEHILVVHTDVSHLYPQHTDNLSFVNLNNGKSFHEVCYDDGVFNPIKRRNKQEVSFKNFTHREKELIIKISEGLSSKDIAEHLNISIHTVRTHRKNILKKSNFKNIHEVVAKFLMI